MYEPKEESYQNSGPTESLVTQARDAESRDSRGWVTGCCGCPVWVDLVLLWTVGTFVAGGLMMTCGWAPADAPLDGAWLPVLISVCVLGSGFLLAAIPVYHRNKLKGRPPAGALPCVIVNLSLGLLCLCIGVPMALNEGRIRMATVLENFERPNRINADCWQWIESEQSVTPAQWQNDVNFIHFSDADWFINRTVMQYTNDGYGNSWCVAPIELSSSSPLYPNCSINAVAVCYEATEGLCTTAGLTVCGWDTPAGINTARVVRGLMLYNSDGAELNYFQQADATLQSIVPPLPSNFSRQYVWWDSEGDEFYQELLPGLLQDRTVLIGVQVTWWALTLIVASILTLTRAFST